MAKKTVSPKPRLASARAASPAAKKPPLAVVIDYPQADEAVRPGHYAVRVTAAGAGQVQLRLDGGEWADCRESVGHFWFDWAPRPASAILEARARSGKGRWVLSGARPVAVAD